MSYNEHSAEVAEDYRHALEDLTMNSRYEITNLTVVARENTEHALAISEALQDHIKKVAPQRKLPALYVLDSIVKNVGTPYTLFFGRKLYQIFMDAYALVDHTTRRKMDEMLKTWKESVPGSIDTRPVFPPDVVRPIENALIKARTTALQAHQDSMRGQQQLLGRGRPPIPFRDTPTPPGPHQQAAPYSHQPYPGMNGTPQGHQAVPQQPYPGISNSAPQHQQQHQFPPRSTPQPAPSLVPAPAYPQPPAQEVYGAPQPGISIDKLNDDIQQLIVATKAEFAHAPLDTSIQTRLRALLDLQSLLQHQNLHQEQLVLVKNQVSELAVNIRAPKPQAQTHTPTPVSSQHPTPIPPPVAVAQPPPPVSATPPAPVSLDALFGQGALATLLAGAKRPATPQSSAPQPIHTPPPAAARAALVSPSGQRPPEPAKPAAAAATDPMALMAMLRKSGLLPPAPGSAPPTGTPGIAPPPVSFPQSLAGLLSPVKAAPVRPLTEQGPGDIPLSTASLRQFRPQLITPLYEALGAPCTQCGRRFKTDEHGRRQKTAHMDWHFRVHQRIAEAEKRGQHRSWYVDEADWAKSREAIDTDYVAPETGAKDSGGSTSTKVPKLQYIPVPEDSQTNSVCPICQEKFEMKWLDEAQEWVWMDAVKVGPRVYHASCHSEATRDRESTPGPSRDTPEPVLGKRKAEGDHSSVRGKLKMEGY